MYVTKSILPLFWFYDINNYSCKVFQLKNTKFSISMHFTLFMWKLAKTFPIWCVQCESLSFYIKQNLNKTSFSPWWEFIQYYRGESAIHLFLFHYFGQNFFFCKKPSSFKTSQTEPPSFKNQVWKLLKLNHQVLKLLKLGRPLYQFFLSFLPLQTENVPSIK